MHNLYLAQPGTHLEADTRDFALIHNDRIADRQPIRDTQQVVMFAGCTIGRSAQRAIQRHRIPSSFIGDQGGITAQSHLSETPVYSTLQQERNGDREFCLAFTQALLRGRWQNTMHLLANAKTSTLWQYHLDLLPALNQWSALQTWHLEMQYRYQKALSLVLGSRCDRFASSRTLAFALLSRELSALLHREGCSAEIGTFHKHCQNHQPLPCDLMEQFRPVVELWLVANTAIIDDCAAFVERWENFAISAIVHPYIGKTTLREALQWQVREYVRAITKTLVYRPFLMGRE